MNLTVEDRELLQKKGITEKQLAQQLQCFKDGFGAMDIVAPATVVKGILKLNTQQIREFVDFFKREIVNYEVLRFVPASGAATRMFKELFEFMSSYDETSDAYKKFISDTRTTSPYAFFENIHEYPFIEELRAVCYKKKDRSLEELLDEHRYIEVLQLMLTDEGLNLGYLPKGLINFHRYDDCVRMPVGEHLVSTSLLLQNSKKINLHFTIGEEFLDLFKERLSLYAEKLKGQYGVDADISFSYQKSSTDTVAGTRSGDIFRQEDGSMLFRPGGHGALIYNLNEVDADLLFIKNIDNVVPDWVKEKNVKYEQLLGGILINYQQYIFRYLEMLDEGVDEKTLEEIKTFVQNELCYKYVPESDEKAQLRRILNRPLRVCGMVINEGEPGGGPFLVKDADGNVSLQILEGSQIDLSLPEQKSVFDNSTHFNPVDIVCGVKDYKGNSFNLLDFVDEGAGFISEKTLKGRKLQALELPGLWNGAMSDWNTVFVEVPDFTFNPVKTVFDLLRPQHRN